MVQKSPLQPSAPRRGRPRAYDPAIALARAMELFWSAGYGATSLDDLSAATGMNRPSLYGAFGDKRALYLATLERYRELARAAMKEALAPDRPLREGLIRVYDMALSIYFPEQGAARGCFMIGTAVTEAASAPEVRAALAEGLREIERAFEDRIRLAEDQGELDSDHDPAKLARIASAILYFLAIRSRAGEPRAALRSVARSSVKIVFGVQPVAGSSSAARAPRLRRRPARN